MLTTRLNIARADRDLADLWVNPLQAMAEQNAAHLVIVVADMARSDLRLSSSFVAQFCQRLSRQSPVLHLARSWLEQQIRSPGRLNCLQGIDENRLRALSLGRLETAYSSARSFLIIGSGPRSACNSRNTPFLSTSQTIGCA
jgi:hypothetical protein